MKKVIALALGLVMLAGCGATASKATPTPAPAASAPAATAIKTGLGNKISVESSKAAAADKDGNAQADVYMAAVSVDGSGKIVYVKIDTAQVKIAFDAKGALKTDLKTEQKTKVELGDAYGMKKNSKIGMDWYQEIAELEKWMTGKTIDQIKAMKTKKVDDAHPAVPDVPELTSKVTVSVQDYIAVVEEAVKNAK